MASIVNPLTAGSAAATALSDQKTTAQDPASKLANEQTFLQLLVAQMRNQNPLSPTDSIQFVTQLAQFSQLEQLIALRQDADALTVGLLAPPPAPDANPQTQS